jgi:hypothetical protein
MTTSGDLFISDLAATQAEVERAESMLKRDGLIPVEDRSAIVLRWCFGAVIAGAPNLHCTSCDSCAQLA